MRRLTGAVRRRRRDRQVPGSPVGPTDLLVITTPGTDAQALARLGLPANADVHALPDLLGEPRERGAVAVVVSDAASLRRVVTGLPGLGSARSVTVLFERDIALLPVPDPDPRWPPLEEVLASRLPVPSVTLTFVEPVQVRAVLPRVAAATASSGHLAVGWPAVGVRRQVPADWPPADPCTTVAAVPRLLDQSGDAPPDLVLAGPAAADRDDLPDADHAVLGRPTRVGIVEPELSWEEWQALPEADAAHALALRGPTSLGAVDEHVVNPIGFGRDPAGPCASLVADGRGLTVELPDADPVRLDPDRGLSDADLSVLRPLAGVRLDWTGGRGPQAYGRAVAGLATAGIPLVADGVPAWAGHLLAPELVAALGHPVRLDDRLQREEHSIRLRRAALRGHATGPWRRGLAERHGLQQSPAPTVSVLLATRRPDMLDFALRQVARQRGAHLELVLAAHGFDPDPDALERFRGASGVPLTTVTLDAGVPFGAVLNRAAARAGGDVLLKMDDDDWYGPDFVADLLLAQHYSGAQLVGCPAEFTYLTEVDVTTRGARPTEAYRSAVAGGTMLVERGLFHRIGGFRETARYVDASLLRAVVGSGAAIYCGHGLGYVLRRAPQGHTWDPGLGWFLEPERAVEQWRGFRPSAVLDPDVTDQPPGPRIP